MKLRDAAAGDPVLAAVEQPVAVAPVGAGGHVGGGGTGVGLGDADRRLVAVQHEPRGKPLLSLAAILHDGGDRAHVGLDRDAAGDATDARHLLDDDDSVEEAAAGAAGPHAAWCNRADPHRAAPQHCPRGRLRRGPPRLRVARSRSRRPHAPLIAVPVWQTEARTAWMRSSVSVLRSLLPSSDAGKVGIESHWLVRSSSDRERLNSNTVAAAGSRDGGEAGHDGWVAAGDL